MNQAVGRVAQAVRSAPCRQMGTYKHITELTLNRPPPKMPKGYDKIIKKREMFQADNGLPTFLKGGQMDFILYRLTVLLVLGGDAYVFTYIPDLIK